MYTMAVQAIGFLGLIAFMISYQIRSNKALYLCQFLGCGLFCLQMFLLGALRYVCADHGCNMGGPIKSAGIYGVGCQHTLLLDEQRTDDTAVQSFVCIALLAFI